MRSEVLEKSTFSGLVLCGKKGRGRIKMCRCVCDCWECYDSQLVPVLRYRSGKVKKDYKF